jgi:hypothetical protein
MHNTRLPPRPSLEFLRKTAKERLAIMRRTNARAQLADALLATAQELSRRCRQGWAPNRQECTASNSLTICTNRPSADYASVFETAMATRCSFSRKGSAK